MQKLMVVASVVFAVAIVVGPVLAQEPVPVTPPGPGANPGANPGAAPAPVPKVPPAPPQNAQQFVNHLVGQVGNNDARIRYAVREGLVAMGAQATPVLQAAKEGQANPHVKAFIDRTLKRLKTLAKRKGRSAFLFLGNNRRDIDRMAMEMNLNWEQMAKLEPIFKKYDRDTKELMAAMREEGGFSDREGWKDLAEEMKLMREETEPKFSEFLDEKQTKSAMRHLGGGLGGFGGNFPISIGSDGGEVKIIQGPGGTTGVMIKKVTVGGEEGPGGEGK